MNVIAHFDTSALIKLTLAEVGSGDAADLWERADLITASQLAYTEARSGLAAAARDGRLSRPRLRPAVERLDALWTEVFAIDLDGAQATLAGILAEQHALGGADAVHIAAALATETDDLVFVTWDQRQAAAALASGLAVAPIDPS